VDTDFIGKTILSAGLTVGFLEQEPKLDPDKTVREVVEEAVQGTVDLMNEFNQINERFAEPMSDDEMADLCERQAAVQEKLDTLDAWDLDSRLEMAMDALRCPPPETKTATLSGGEKRRVALCRLLLQQPDILLLDEPTNHLDAESVAWLEHHLQRYPGTIIAVTHDRYFLDNVAGWILELDRGEGIPWKGNYSSWLEQKQEKLRQEEKTESERRKTLQRELEWIRMSPKGRHAKGRARITSYEDLLGQEGERRAKDLEIYIPPGPRLGKTVVEIEGVSKAYGDQLLVENMSFNLPPGGIVGIIGPNGAGKTTLFRMITGQEQPDSGTIRVGETVTLAYVDQSRDALDPEKSVWEVITGGQEILQLGKQQVNSRAYVSRFNLSGSDQQKKVGALSGGERNRVHLARMLKVPVTAEKFFLEAHVKLQPVDLPVDGTYVCGLAHSPRSMDETIAQAQAAAGRACHPLARGSITPAPIVSKVDPEKCIGCGACEAFCPYKAITIYREDKSRKARTLTASCKGCGVCAARCPTMAIDMGRFTLEGIMAQIKAFGEGARQ